MIEELFAVFNKPGCAEELSGGRCEVEGVVALAVDCVPCRRGNGGRLEEICEFLLGGGVGGRVAI